MDGSKTNIEPTSKNHVDVVECALNWEGILDWILQLLSDQTFHLVVIMVVTRAVTLVQSLRPF
jgi:hypothetical protein